MKFIMKGLLVFVVVVVGLNVIGQHGAKQQREDNKKAEALKVEQCKSWREMVETVYLKNGLFTSHSADWDEVQINPVMWQRITADNKQTIIGNTAKCMADGAIMFKDRMSGKVLGDKGYFSSATIYP